MTRVLLTFLVGLLVSLGTLVSGDPVLAKNWNQSKSQIAIQDIQRNIHTWSDQFVCEDLDFYFAGGQGLPPTHYSWVSHDHLPSDYKALLFSEAKRRGLTCGVGATTQIASSTSVQLDTPASGQKVPKSITKLLAKISHFRQRPNEQELNSLSLNDDGTRIPDCKRYFTSSNNETGRRCFGIEDSSRWAYVGQFVYQCNPNLSGRRGFFCTRVQHGLGVYMSGKRMVYRGALKRGRFDGSGILVNEFGEVKEGTFKEGKLVASSPVTTSKPKVTSAALTAAEKEAERLRQELAAIKAQQKKQQQTISSDTQKPTIQIAGTASNGPQGTIKGFVRDNTGIAELRVDGQLVKVDSYGNFMANTYVPEGGVSVSIQAVDLAGLSSSMSVRLDRSVSNTTASISFERLNPLGRKVAKNKDALALIIGVDGYKSTPSRAIYADSDAKVFSDYASQKLGIPTNRIKTLVNDGADESGMLLAVKDWLSRASKRDKSDVYVFFAGHGLASQDGKKMYLLPYDGSPRLLDDTAILRDRLFSDIASANPRSVTVFLDTCYSGTTRGTDMLIASRPIAIKALEQSIPDNFTVMTAAAGDQTAKPLEEAKHGMFSYFLMKGMEGEADKNQDNKITAGELHSYVQSNVVQQSSGSQTPELQGDAERVLVRFQ